MHPFSWDAYRLSQLSHFHFSIFRRLGRSQSGIPYTASAIHLMGNGAKLSFERIISKKIPNKFIHHEQLSLEENDNGVLVASTWRYGSRRQKVWVGISNQSFGNICRITLFFNAIKILQLDLLICFLFLKLNHWIFLGNHLLEIFETVAALNSFNLAWWHISQIIMLERLR